MIAVLLQRLYGCDHDWRYDPDETMAGPWTGYIETCVRCGQIRQVPQ